ncbi:hypothetical protein [Mixta mediterraneensis]|uniref:hypothetical protein n=1 Tax=Mixta mediterraneensis TaxID=2758443 RepID=UPI001EEF20FB|nr:hypothetical protein [Mixta mediterraneensis]
MMRLPMLFLITALSAIPALTAAQMAEPFSPPAGLHPHSQATQHEILGDGQLPQHSQDNPATPGFRGNNF